MTAIRFPLAFGRDEQVERTDEPGDYEHRPDEDQPHEDFDAFEDRRLDRSEDAAYHRERGR